MNMMLPDVDRVVDRLKKIEGVSKVIVGSISHAPHAQRAGDLKWVGSDGKSATIRAFSRHGMQNLHVYGDIDKLQKSLATQPKQPSNGAAALPPETKIERKAREQPIYPATPSPMKSAEPVKDDEIRGKLVTITPDVAYNWLERNTRNRPLRNSDVARYANDMRAGRWMPGGVIVKFAKDGSIINGQHTLWAVIESGTPIQAYVLTGLDPDVVMVEDDHARRRLTDVIRITHPGSHISNIHTAVGTLLRASMAWHRGESGHGMHITRQQEMAFLDEYMEPIDFSVRAFASKGNKRGISIAAVITPLVRAWYTQDREKLARFAQVVSTGIVEDVRENAAVLLRNFLLSQTATASTMLLKQSVYRRVERALSAYLNTEKLQVLKPVQDEQFLLPGEKRRPRKS